MPDRFPILIAASLLALTTGCTHLTKSPLGKLPGFDIFWSSRSKVEPPTPDENEMRHNNRGPQIPLGMLNSEIVSDWTVTCPVTKCQELGGLIKTPEQWKEVWQRFHGDEPLPEVDFTSKWVYLMITDAKDPNGSGVIVTVYEDGTICPEVVSTLIGWTPSDECKSRFYLIDLSAGMRPYFMREIDPEYLKNPYPGGVY